MGKEIERKFLIPIQEGVKHRQKLFYTRNIEQGYISISNPEIRIRKEVGRNINQDSKIKESYFLTFKTGKEFVREEANIKINKENYLSLTPFLKTKLLKKERIYVTNDNGYIFEIDRFEDDVFNFSLVEVEFKSVGDAINFDPPNWFGEEVTNDFHYKNANLVLMLDEYAVGNPALKQFLKYRLKRISISKPKPKSVVKINVALNYAEIKHLFRLANCEDIVVSLKDYSLEIDLIDLIEHCLGYNIEDYVKFNTAEDKHLLYTHIQQRG